jgi:hypothetical protein
MYAIVRDQAAVSAGQKTTPELPASGSEILSI